MAWTVEYNLTARSQLRRLDRQTSRRIAEYMDQVGTLANPRHRGKALTGKLAGHWRYRVGDYRVICQIQDDVLRILVVRVDRRDQVYR